MLDRRTAKAAAIFFTVALLNPRDFPIPNVPLIYPAFLLFWLQMGTRTMMRGFMRVRFLFLLLLGYQMYAMILKMALGKPVSLGDWPFVHEPAMILVAAGAAGVRPGATKAATWILVSVITISAAFGVGIYTIGEPFTSVRSTIQHSVGGMVGSGTVLRDMDFEMQLREEGRLNSGLSADVVIFGYMLAAVTTIVVASMLAKRPSAGVPYGYLVLALVVLLAGIITNTERATVLAVLVGLAAFVFTDSLRRVLSARTIALMLVGVVCILLLVNVSQRWADRGSLVSRGFADPATLIRLYMSIPAVTSIVHEPLGAGGMSAHYEEAAFQLGWLTVKDGATIAHTPHNHFAGLVMVGGIAGLVASVLLLAGLWKKLKGLRRGEGSVYARLLAAACVASVVHSLFHNAGFFGLVPPTQIVFALLWSETWVAKRRRPTLPKDVIPLESPVQVAT